VAALGKALKSLKATFRELDAAWYLFGAQAAFVYGAQRTTIDADVTMIQGHRASQEIADALVAHDFALRFPDPTFVARTRVVPIVHLGGMLVDVVLGGGGFDDVFAARAVKHRVDGILVPVATAEDIVVMKVSAGRPKDNQDVIAMLRSPRTNVDPEKVRDDLATLEAILDQSDLLPAFEALLKHARHAR
jgi:hypothetical protein